MKLIFRINLKIQHMKWTTYRFDDQKKNNIFQKYYNSQLNHIYIWKASHKNFNESIPLPLHQRTLPTKKRSHDLSNTTSTLFWQKKHRNSFFFFVFNYSPERPSDGRRRAYDSFPPGKLAPSFCDAFRYYFFFRILPAVRFSVLFAALGGFFRFGCLCVGSVPSETIDSLAFFSGPEESF